MELLLGRSSALAPLAPHGSMKATMVRNRHLSAALDKLCEIALQTALAVLEPFHDHMATKATLRSYASLTPAEPPIPGVREPAPPRSSPMWVAWSASFALTQCA